MESLLTPGEKKLIIFCIQNAYQGIPPTCLMYTMQRWFSPCDSATVGYIFIPECSNNLGKGVKWALSSKLGLGAVCIVSFWFNIDALGTYVFYLVSISFLWYYCIVLHLRLFQKNSVNIIKSGKKRSLLVFRELQLLNRYHNGIQQGALILAYMFLITNIFIIGNYVLITMGSDIALTELVMFSLVCVQSFLYILVYFGIASRVYSDSKRVINGLKENIVPRINNGDVRKWAQNTIFQNLKSVWAWAYLDESYASKCYPTLVDCFSLVMYFSNLHRAVTQ
ncbi:unnamed protein product [Orchesella dallaii]|uniref:Gustatory receptor n=1 Tax=Orchesella dallaii TaxID=48710 RepID=A0ABP1RHD9_9HEXA